MSSLSRTLSHLAIAVFAAFATAACGRSAPKTDPPISPDGEVWLTDTQVREANIVVAPLEERNIEDTILAGGRIAFDDSRVQHVLSPVNGRVTRIDAQVGQRVKKGQVLAVIESPDVGIATADLGKAQADFAAAEHELARQKLLAEAHATSEQSLERAEDEFRKARAEVDRAKQKAVLFRGGAVDKVSQTYALTAGIGGEVISRSLGPGAEVQGQYSGSNVVELLTIGELDQVWVVADIYEMDVPRVHAGERVKVSLAAFSKESFDGVIDWVSGTLDPATRTARIRCTLPNADRRLKPEMNATVRISVEERRALAVRRSAIVRLGDRTYVFVDANRAVEGRRRFDRVAVTVDEGEGDEWVFVDHGLEPGARVVVAGALLLSGAASGRGR